MKFYRGETEESLKTFQKTEGDFYFVRDTGILYLYIDGALEPLNDFKPISYLDIRQMI